MGCYLETGTRQNKVEALLGLGARVIPEPVDALDLVVSPNLYLVCVIENPAFDAAAWVYSTEELRRFKYDWSGHPRTWLLVPRTVVETRAPMFRTYAERGREAQDD